MSGGRFAIHKDMLYPASGNNNEAKILGTIGCILSAAFSQIRANACLFNILVSASDGTTLFVIYGDATPGSLQFPNLRCVSLACMDWPMQDSHGDLKAKAREGLQAR
jgi:hypothetical protein